MAKINPIDRIDQTNITEHDRMIDAINANDDLSNSAISTANTAKNTADHANVTAGVAKTTAENAQATADQAKATGEDNTADIATANGRIDTTIINVTTLQNTLKATLVSASFSADGSTVTMILTRQDGNTISVVMPVASAIQSGIMNPATYKSMTGLDARITALETKPQTYIVTLPSQTPSSSDVDTAYHAQYPDAPYPALGNTTIRDVTKALSYTYSTGTATWIEDNNPTEPTATNTTLGVVMGSAGTLGKIYVESDGSMSVNGWDDAKNDISNLKLAVPEKAATLDVTKDSTGKVVLELKKTDGTVISTIDINSISDSGVTATEGCLISKTEYAKAKAGEIATTKPVYVVGVNALDGNAKLFPFPEGIPSDLSLENIILYSPSAITSGLTISSYTINTADSGYQLIARSNGGEALIISCIMGKICIPNLLSVNKYKDSFAVETGGTEGYTIAYEIDQNNITSLLDTKTLSYLDDGIYNVKYTSGITKQYSTDASKIKYLSCKGTGFDIQVTILNHVITSATKVGTSLRNDSSSSIKQYILCVVKVG